MPIAFDMGLTRWANAVEPLRAATVPDLDPGRFSFFVEAFDMVIDTVM